MAIEGGVWCGSDLEGDLEDPKERAAIEDELACYQLTGNVSANATSEPRWPENPKVLGAHGFSIHGQDELFPFTTRRGSRVKPEELTREEDQPATA